MSAAAPPAPARGIGTPEELRLFLDLLRTLRVVTEIFGPAGDADDLRSAYRRLTKVCHPDRFTTPQDKAVAEEAFRLLTRWRDVGLEQLADGTYGEVVREPVITLRAKRHTYRVEPDCAFAGAFSTVYRAMDEDNTIVALKVAATPGFNGLLTNERQILEHLTATIDPKFEAYFPRLDDHFLYQDGSGRRAVTVQQWQAGSYTLEEIRRAYPTGIDPKDLAWIFRRLLVALDVAHAADVLHGAVLPPNVLIYPAEHGLVLVGWTAAVRSTEGEDPATAPRITAIDASYEAWYPPEVTAKEVPLVQTDIHMAARCMRYLLDGQTSAAAQRIDRFLRSCTLANPLRRPRNARGLLREFNQMIEELWGERKFHPFAMPSPSPR